MAGAESVHLLILGGSPNHLGGVEAFCERAADALSQHVDWRIRHIPTGTAYLRPRRLPAFLRGLTSLIKYRASQPECVWLQYVNLFDLVYLALAKLLGHRVVVTPHLGSNWRSQTNPLLRRVSVWLLGYADRLALISETQEREIALPASVPRSLIRNILPGALLDAESTPMPSASAGLKLIHSGRLSEGKGTFLFVEVCKRLEDARVPFVARITGATDAATYANLRRRIAELGLQERVLVLGRVPEHDLFELLRSSDVLVHLSRIDSYPLIVLEAMACAVVPICMELAGARDMVERYDGFVVSAANAVEEAALCLIRQSPAALRWRGVATARSVRQDYSWSLCASLLEDALRATGPVAHSIPCRAGEPA